MVSMVTLGKRGDMALDMLFLKSAMEPAGIAMFRTLMYSKAPKSLRSLSGAVNLSPQRLLGVKVKFLASR